MYFVDVYNSAGWVANSVDPENAAYDLGLRCLLKPTSPNI